MKKSILSLSAAVALGGLGFAGSANAWVAFDSTGTDATTLLQHPAGVGHMLFTPYYTANDGLSTLVNIVNTDSANGKAVKVRFRGASNSDDVLDFTLFLSPGDVWTGYVSEGADGRATISTQDKSCTIPAAAAWEGGVPFNTLRLPSYVTADTQAALTREGYVEVLDMANILPNTALFKATKHVNGVAPCDTLDVANLVSTVTNVSAARAYGLDNPTGGLMGTWAILNLSELGTYSGTQTALVASTATTLPVNGTVASAKGNMVFFPQEELPAGNVDAYTADPLLTYGSGTSAIVAPLWFDLPDLSTPLVTSATSPAVQADALSAALAKASVSNEYVATAADAKVPFTTDWVVSQPTRRYHAVVNYGTSAATSSKVARGDLYQALILDQKNAFGPQLCLNMEFSSTDREEKEVKVTSGGSFSPGSAPTKKPFCGEVFVLQLGTTSTLHAAITKQAIAPVGDAGWATLGVTTGSVPMVGYAAIDFQNAAAGTRYGWTFQHRWVK